MSKIYSAVDADEAEQFIGQEGYFGNTLEAVLNKSNKLRLERIVDEANVNRFCTYAYTFPLFQLAEKQN